MTASTYAPEFEELTDETRKQLQLEQSERLTMVGHVRNLLRMRRNRVAEAWGQSGESKNGQPESADDDMQLLTRDIIINETHPAPQPAAAPVKQEKPRRNWLPWATAIALSGAIPTTTGILMLPKIIAAFRPAPIVAPTQPSAEYAPILKPGKPSAAE